MSSNITLRPTNVISQTSVTKKVAVIGSGNIMLARPYHQICNRWTPTGALVSTETSNMSNIDTANSICIITSLNRNANKPSQKLDMNTRHEYPTRHEYYIRNEILLLFTGILLRCISY